MCTLDPHWTAYLSALLTPTVAGIAGWIAYQQARTARAKLKLDLFEKRIGVYNEVTACLGHISRTGNTSSENDQRFLVAMHKAKWLFGAEVLSYLEAQLWANMCELHSVSTSLSGMEHSEQRTAKIKTQADLKLWFAKQGKEGLDPLFLPYLSFETWK